MNVRVWKGYHGGSLATLISRAWEREELLILCPPMLKDYSFLSALPEGELHVEGAWSDSEVASLRAVHRSTAAEKVPAVLGVFTSGTLSASPRLVLYTRENIVASLSSVFALFDVRRIEHVYCYPQAFHTFGLTLGYVAAHLFGWVLHTPEGKYQRTSHAERLVMDSERVLTLGTPTHFYDLLQTARGRALSPTYTCIMGGASVTRGLWRQVRDELNIRAPSIGYGCTEASPAITHLDPGVEPILDGEIGFPLGSLQSILTDEGVKIAGPGVCAAIVQNGLLERPQALTIRDRIHKSPEGRWVYDGRLDLTLNRGGQKFSLEAIERLLGEKLSVNIVACAIGDTRLGEDLGLMMLAPRERESLVHDAQLILQSTLGLKLTPSRVLFADDFPLNECSKLDRRAVARKVEQ